MMTQDAADSVPTSQTYFADLEYESQQFAGEVFAFAESYVEWAVDGGLENRWVTNTCLYQGVDPASNSTGQWDENTFAIVGDNGELLSSNYNDYRNLLTHILNMTVAQPPNMLAKAINDEDASLIAAQTFDGVFQYYLTTHKSGRLLKQSRQCVEYSLFLDSGFMLCEWNADDGAPLGPKMIEVPVTDELGQTSMTQQPAIDEATGQELLEYEGDFDFKARSVWDVFFDPGAEDEEEADWVLVRDNVNKYEYAKKYPKHAARILGASSATSSDRMRQWRKGFNRPKKTNLIDVWKFYHRPTQGMPKGRMSVLLDPACVLEDGPNKYDRLPVFQVKANDGLGCVTGYAPGNVIAPVQMSRNVLSSAMMTNFAMFGVQNVAVKDTDQYDVSEIAGSMNVLRYADTPPVALQLGAQMNGIDEHFDRLGTVGETLSGVNSVVRGDPESSLKSGKALGIVQAAAVQFQSALAASYAQFLKDIGNFMLYCFRRFIKSERVTQIVGENDRMQSATWDQDTFGPIDRVEAELVDPAMRTLGYKTDLAMFLVQNGLVATAQEFLTVLTTGQLKPLIRAQLTEINLVHQENRDMLEVAKETGPQLQQMQQAILAAMQADPTGQSAALMQQQFAQTIQSLMPPVSIEDDDMMHLAEHKTVCSSPATRRNSVVQAIADAHNQAHRDNIVKKAVRDAQMQLMVQAQTAQMAAQMGMVPAGAEEGQEQGGKSANKSETKQAA